MVQLAASRSQLKIREGAVLASAVAKAADIWQLSNETVGAIVGLSAPSVSRLRAGKKALERGTKPFELSQLFVRLFRSLDSLMGSDDQAAIAWLKSPNLDLRERPIALITTVRGLVEVADYVDDFRGRT